MKVKAKQLFWITLSSKIHHLQQFSKNCDSNFRLQNKISTFSELEALLSCSMRLPRSLITLRYPLDIYNHIVKVSEMQKR